MNTEETVNVPAEETAEVQIDGGNRPCPNPGDIRDAKGNCIPDPGAGK